MMVKLCFEFHVNFTPRSRSAKKQRNANAMREAAEREKEIGELCFTVCAEMQSAKILISLTRREFNFIYPECFFSHKSVS